MRYLIIMILAFVVVNAVWLMATIIPAAGVTVQLDPLLVDQCRRVEIAPGTEDVTIDAELNIAFISAADRRDWYNETSATGVNPANGIYTLTLDGNDIVTRVSPEMENFLPHGIFLWRGEANTRRLFVVNHPRSGEELIEIFNVGEAGALTHLESISFDEMHSPNDVLAIGPRQFYVTNDRGFEDGIMAVMESYYALPFSSVAYYDGEAGSIAAKNLVYANGINISADGETIYVAEILKQRIAVMSRDPQTGLLKKQRSLRVNTGPDNIEVAEDGALWVAGHSKVFEFLDHAKDASKSAPSHVIRVDPKTGGNEDVFISIDGELNASSVGAVLNDTLIVGAVFDGHVMVCPLAAG